jgi:hypothetical protein
MKPRLLAVVTIGAILLASCNSDTGRGAELEEQLLTENREIASLESDLFTSTSTSITTTTTITTAAIKGTIALGSGDHRSSADSSVCWGDRGYDDISEGTDVVVRDGDGVVIGTSSLDAGLRIERTEDFGNYSFWHCEFSFAVSVPADSPFYAVEVSHHDELTYSNADMVARNWTVAFSLD